MASRVPATAKGLPLKDTQNLGAPNQTLYVKNLDDKVNKNELKRALYMLFSTYGPVLDIVTTRVGAKGQSMRGQAHVVFRDIQTSTQAMRSLQGFEFLGREMRIAYGKGMSQIVPKLRGTFEPPATAAAPATEASELQKSIFNIPPSNIAIRPNENGTKANDESLPHGLKRPREDDEEEEEEEEKEEKEENDGDEDKEENEVSMDEDEDDAPMEEDEDD